MTVLEFSKFLEQKTGLSNLGFSSVRKREGYGLIRYHREKIEGRIDLLGISISSYSETKKEHGIFIGYKSIIKGVSFNIVNEIFEQAQIKLLNSNWNSSDFYNHDRILSIKHPTWTKTQNNYSAVSDNLLNSDKSLNLKKVEKACNTLRDVIEEQILPFYDLYPDLQSVNNEIIDQFKTPKELSGYISGQIGLKKMAIMGLCNNPKYTEYISEYEEKLNKGVQQNRDKYFPYLDFFYRLKSVLKNYGKKEKRTDNNA